MNKTGKHVVLSGYYGFENLGDEAVLQSIIQALRGEDPTLKITVLSADTATTAARYGVESEDRWKLGKIFGTLKSADLLISGGGSLLQDVTSQMTIPYYLGVVGMARMLGKKVAFYAQGVGPIEGQLGRRLTRMVANRVQLITVRDGDSQKLLKEIGVTRPPVEVTVDPVVLLKPVNPQGQEYRELLRLHERCRVERRPLIAIAPRPWKELQGFQQALVETARRLMEEERAEILLIPMHRSQDLPFCQEMARVLPGAKVLEEVYQPAEMLAVFELLDLLIGIRLHALILAGVAHLPLVGITYDPKIDAFLHRLDDHPVAGVESLEAGALFLEVQYRLRDRENQVQRVRMRMNELQEKARANARMVLSLIN